MCCHVGDVGVVTGVVGTAAAVSVAGDVGGELFLLFFGDVLLVAVLMIFLVW